MFSDHPWRSLTAYTLKPPMVINSNFCFLGVNKCFAPLFQMFCSILKEGFCFHYFPPYWLYFNLSSQWGTHSFLFPLKLRVFPLQLEQLFLPGCQVLALGFAGQVVLVKHLSVMCSIHRVRMVCKVQTGKLIKTNIQMLAQIVLLVLKYSVFPTSSQTCNCCLFLLHILQKNSALSSLEHLIDVQEVDSRSTLGP